MADFTDGYLYGYKWMLHVYDGTLQSQDSPLGTFTGVKYRLIETEEEDLDQGPAQSGGLEEIQSFELWSITLDSGNYMPKPNDLFTDIDGGVWPIIKAERGDLRTSARISPTITITCRKRQ